MRGKVKKNLLRFIGLYLLHYLIAVLLKTLQIKTINESKINSEFGKRNNVVLAFWHGTMLLPWYINRSNNFSALVSQSEDGEILTKTLEKWNYDVTRGSSNIGGKDAMEILLNRVEEGKNIAITPDGPTGPPHVMKAGAVVTAKKSKSTLFLVGVGIKNKYVLNSWDSFEIPKPFTTVTLVYSDPIIIDNNLNYEETSLVIKECEIKLNELQEKAYNYCLN